jgi:hypothetical protein
MEREYLLHSEKQLHILYIASPTPSSFCVLVFCPSKHSFHLLHFQFITHIHKADGRNAGTMGVQWPILMPNTSVHSFLGLNVDKR